MLICKESKPATPEQKLHCIVVARLLKPLQRLVKNDLLWATSEVPGTDLAEVWHQEIHWQWTDYGAKLATVFHEYFDRVRP